jgi:hypothetical protein
MTAAVVDPLQTREPNLISKEHIAARTLILVASGALAGRLISTIPTHGGAIFGAIAAIASSAAANFLDIMQMKSSACKIAYFVASLFATFGAAHLIALAGVIIASTAYAIILQTKSKG